jgi:hypothetical protein
MFSSKKSSKKFWQKLHAPSKLRSSAPSVLFQLGPTEQPLNSAEHTASPVDLADSDAASSSESSGSLPHGPPHETASDTSDSDRDGLETETSRSRDVSRRIQGLVSVSSRNILLSSRSRDLRSRISSRSRPLRSRAHVLLSSFS